MNIFVDHIVPIIIMSLVIFRGAGLKVLQSWYVMIGIDLSLLIWAIVTERKFLAAAATIIILIDGAMYIRAVERKNSMV